MTKKKTGYYRLRMISNQWFLLKYTEKFEKDGHVGPFDTIQMGEEFGKNSGLKDLDKSPIDVKVPYGN